MRPNYSLTMQTEALLLAWRTSQNKQIHLDIDKVPIEENSSAERLRAENFPISLQLAGAARQGVIKFALAGVKKSYFERHVHFLILVHLRGVNEERNRSRIFKIIALI